MKWWGNDDDEEVAICGDKQFDNAMSSSPKNKKELISQVKWR